MTHMPKKTKLPDPIRIEHLVFAALDRAYDNGYTLHQDMSHAQIADDLISYEATLEDVPPESLIQPIAKYIEKYEASYNDEDW